MEVQAHYDQKLLRSLFVEWTDQCIQHGDDLSLVESFRDVKEEGESLNSSKNRIDAISHYFAAELHRKVFRHWLYSTRKNLELSRKLERKLVEDNRATLEIVWEKWRDRFGESALLEQELQVVERRNSGSKRRVLNSLINRSLVCRSRSDWTRTHFDCRFYRRFNSTLCTLDDESLRPGEIKSRSKSSSRKRQNGIRSKLSVRQPPPPRFV